MTLRTPWHQVAPEEPSFLARIVHDDAGEHVALFERAETAAAAVEAVNAFERVVQERDELAEECGRLRAEVESAKSGRGAWHDSSDEHYDRAIAAESDANANRLERERLEERVRMLEQRIKRDEPREEQYQERCHELEQAEARVRELELVTDPMRESVWSERFRVLTARAEKAESEARALRSDNEEHVKRCYAAEAAAVALRERIERAIVALLDTRWNPSGELRQWQHTSEGKNHALVMSALEALRGS